MNHENAAALIGRIRPGTLATIRLPNGSTVTGRAYTAPEGLFIRDAARFIRAVTTGNIVRVGL